MYTHPEASLLVAEIDPAVTRIAREHLWLRPPPNLRIVHRDGRVALQQLPAQPLFDVVLGDAIHDVSIPSHLITREFAQEIARRLRRSGTYAPKVVDFAESPRLLFSMVKTLRPVFETVEVGPMPSNWPPGDARPS